MPENARPFALLLLALIAAPHAASAEGPYRNRDNKDPKDLSEGTYPIPYQKPTVAEITEVLERVRGYLDATSPTRVVDGRTGVEITDFSVPNVEARIPDGAGEAFYPLDYTMGVTHSGMLLAHEVTGDPGSRSTRAGSSSSSPTASRTSARSWRRARGPERRPSGPSSRPAPSTTRGPCAPPS